MLSVVQACFWLLLRQLVPGSSASSGQGHERSHAIFPSGRKQETRDWFPIILPAIQNPLTCDMYHPRADRFRRDRRRWLGKGW